MQTVKTTHTTICTVQIELIWNDKIYSNNSSLCDTIFKTDLLLKPVLDYNLFHMDPIPIVTGGESGYSRITWCLIMKII